MRLLLLASTAAFLFGCAQHSKAWDDAYADCQAQAVQQWETAGLPDDQMSTFQENYINSCMQKKGLKA